MYISSRVKALKLVCVHFFRFKNGLQMYGFVFITQTLGVACSQKNKLYGALKRISVLCATALFERLDLQKRQTTLLVQKRYVCVQNINFEFVLF